MQTELAKQKTTTEEETFAMGEEFAKQLSEEAVVLMYGDPGAGKTVFTKGMAKTLGITEEITSPTFALVNIYERGKIQLLHFDMYRIESEEEAYEAGLLDLLCGGGIKVVEWSENIEEYFLPKTYYKVEIAYRENGRIVEITKEQA